MKTGFARGIYSAASYLLTPVATARLGIKSRSNSGYRHHLRERFGYVESPRRKARHVHFHAVSVGETLAATPIIKLLSKEHSDLSISLSVTTPTGREQAQKHLSELADISYLPFDTPGPVRRFLSRIQPNLLVMVETELWPNLVNQCHKNNIPTLLLNGRMSEKSARSYQKLSPITKAMMSQIDVVIAQFAEDAKRFEKLGASSESILTLGNLKFDAQLSEQMKMQAKSLRESWQLAHRPVWIAASTHPGEEEALLEVHVQLREKIPNLLLILAPRHPERRSEIEAMLFQRGVTHIARSNLDQQSSVAPDHSVLLLDTLGELNLIYGLADVAFIGGSLVQHGGHNPIEPALWALPIVTGLHCHNFLEITEQLAAAGSLRQCTGGSDLREWVEELLSQEELREQVGNASQKVIVSNQGSLERQKAQIERLLYQ